jgi:hypothetical protein
MVKMFDGEPASGVGEQPLLRRRQRVRRAARDVLEIEAIRRQPRVRAQEPLDGSRLEAQDLGLDVGRLRVELRGELRHLLLHGEMRRVARVLIGEQARIHVDARQLLVEAVQRVERRRERRRRRAELALELLQLRHVRLDLLYRGAPGIVGRIDVGEIPFVFVGNLRSLALLRRALQRHDGERGRNEQQT